MMETTPRKVASTRSTSEMLRGFLTLALSLPVSRGWIGALTCAYMLVSASFVQGSTLGTNDVLSVPKIPSATSESATVDRALVRILASVTKQHPSIAAEIGLRRAIEQDFEAAKLQRYPNFSVISQTNGSKPGLTLAADLPLWNAGKTTALIASAESNVGAQEAKTTEAQLSLALRVIDAWQSARQAQEKLIVLSYNKIKLTQFKDMMARRIDSQVSPPIEAELVTTRLLQAEADEFTAKSALQLALKKLSQLSGETVNETELTTTQSNNAFNSLLNNAALLERYVQSHPELNEHPSIVRAKLAASAGKTDAKARDAARFPEVYFRVQHTNSVSNTNSQAAFIGLRYETGGGFATAVLAKGAQERAQALEQNVNAIRRDLTDAFETERESLRTALARTSSLSAAAASSRLVVESYERLFIAGKRSWQEVLNALRESNDYQVGLAEARVQTISSVWRLRARSATNFERGFFEY